MDFSRKMILPPDKKVDLAKFDPADTHGYKHDHKTNAKLAKTVRRIDELQYMFYAERNRALLIVLEGMDTAGKDGTIRHVMSGVNPQGCSVTSFKVPNSEELAHDFLWRIHKAVPEKGMFGIFNRSHYEDVLVVRVHKLVPKDIWKARYDEINRFEKNLAENDVTILKFFLHISKGEQKKRLEERLDDPRKKWKLSEADEKERKLWDEYVTAYEAMLHHTSTEYAPWYIIPSDHKWFRNLAVSQIILETLEGFDLHFPQSPQDS
jgi:PPK2 family polyphosphate:nucleotide phosphotransferase